MNEHNVRLAQRMIEYIAERSGEDRAAVFLDIIIQFIFSDDARLDSPFGIQRPFGKTVHLQQQMLNDIAAIYGIQAPALKTGHGDDDIPF